MLWLFFVALSASGAYYVIQAIIADAVFIIMIRLIYRRIMIMKINTFGIIGGDKRQLYCAQSIARDGYGVFLYGFDEFEYGEEMAMVPNCELRSAAEADAVILPMPLSKDGKNLYAPYSGANDELKTVLELIGNEKPVFSGIYGKADAEITAGLNIRRYSDREDFAAANAVPTAEGAIELAMKEYSGTINGSRCLVSGCGKCGRVLSSMLKGLCADVTVYARKSTDRVFAEAVGMKSISSLSLGSEYDLIFNTVPAQLFDALTLAKIASEAIVIDLASLPGGVDDKAAERMNIKVLHALSLPGKAAPKTAGIIIKNAVYNMLKEDMK